jgi:Ca2+-binding RTX toxin-like protein
MPDLSTVLTPGVYAAWVYDPQRGMIDIVGPSGALRGWSIDAQAYSLDLALGGTPNTLEISANGQFLIAGNSANGSLTRLNLATRGVDTIAVPLARGTLHLAAGADGSLIFTGQTSQTGVNPYQQVSIGAAAPTPQPVAALAGLDPFEAFLRSDDHRYLVLQQGGASNNPIQLYDTTTGSIVARTDTNGSALGHGDVSTAAGLVADVMYANIYVYDLNLRLVRDLSNYQGGGQAVGATFTDDGHQLLIWRAPIEGFGGTATVFVLDTQTWQQVGAFTPTLATGLGPNNSSRFGIMDVAGQLLVMDNGNRLELVDLAARMKLTVTGDNQDQSLWGAIGQDSLSGGGGRDILIGGRGADTLAGGSGGDIFTVGVGDSPADAGGFDVVTDWASDDALAFGRAAATASTYVEASASDFASAKALADQQIAGGAVDYVAVAAGGDVYVFADSRGDNGAADDVVRLAGRTLADIGPEGIVGAPSVGGSGGLTLPPLPPAPSGGARASIVGNMDAAHLADLLPATLLDATPTQIVIRGAGDLGLTVGGTGFTYLNDQLVGGVARTFFFADAPGGGATVLRLQVDGGSVAASQLLPWLAADATQTAFQAILVASDIIGGSPGADVMRGYTGDDLIYGLGGGDTMWGGPGNDVLYVGLPPNVTDLPFGGRVGATADSFLRGEDGDDFIVGGPGFDNTHGNLGNDTISGGGFDDWVVGGQGNDLLFGDDGGDLCYGNLGADTIDGGAGADGVVGGQGNDVLNGGAGNDFIITGDRGDDTVTGGAGADTFRSFNQTGTDRVTDFNAAEGDRVTVDVGSTYTLSQVGADTVIDMGGGNQMILVGVTLSSLPAGWITGG